MALQLSPIFGRSFPYPRPGRCLPQGWRGDISQKLDCFSRNLSLVPCIRAYAADSVIRTRTDYRLRYACLRLMRRRDICVCLFLVYQHRHSPKSDVSHTGVTYLQDLPRFSPSSSALAAGRVRTRQSQRAANGRLGGGGETCDFESSICVYL